MPEVIKEFMQQTDKEPPERCEARELARAWKHPYAAFHKRIQVHFTV